jgi:hypothetical protein
MSVTSYNGWKNYATWGVALVLDNEQSTYNEARNRAHTIEMHAPGSPQVIDGIWTKEQAARFVLADWLKDYVEELCGLESDELSMMARQMIGAALSDVDWDEIASHYLEG